jgi:hypothetical protein
MAAIFFRRSDMKKTILICGLLVVGLVTLSGCYAYGTRADLGVDYYGYPVPPYGSYYNDPYLYDPFNVSAGYYPYYPSYLYYPYYYPGFYNPYFYPYPFFSLGFGFVRGFDGHFERGGRAFRGSSGSSRSGGGRSFSR